MRFASSMCGGALASWVLAATIALPTAATAQAIAPESSTYHFQAFGLYTAASPGYEPSGASSFDPLGLTLGADVMIRPFRSIQPGIEARASFATGSQVRERTLLPGLRLQTHIGRFTPYINFLVGIGDEYNEKQTNPSLKLDNSIVYSPGGGVDYQISPRFSARLDYQRQFWEINNHPVVKFQPSWYSVGVVYRFRPFIRH